MAAIRLCATLLGLTLVTPACGADETSRPSGTARAPRPDRGRISGRVTFTGARPKPAVVRMGPDTSCLELAGTAPGGDDVVISPEGAVSNAFVYIKSGLSAERPQDPPARPAVLAQRGCRFVPRVVGLQVGQPIEIVNRDPLDHNVHAMGGLNPAFNRTQPVQGMRETRVFGTPEVMVRITCDTHAWMSAFVGVLDHPYFAVSGDDGTFALPDVPPGQYIVEAWHERLGTRTASVHVAAQETRPLAFTYAGN